MLIGAPSRDFIRRVLRRTKAPVVCIGGIHGEFVRCCAPAMPTPPPRREILEEFFLFERQDGVWRRRHYNAGEGLENER